MAQTLSELRALLESQGFAPRKSFSQNFLVDRNIIQKIVDCAAIEPGDSVLEIGPGAGALTYELLKRGAKVFAIEIDRGLAKLLQENSPEGLTVICDDALNVDLSPIMDHGPIKVVANLPYHITSALLAKLLPLKQVVSLTVMVQKEVADRMSTLPGSKEYGRLSLMCTFYAELKSQFKVGKHAFHPKPNVDSAIVHLVRKSPVSDIDTTAFFALVQKAFGQRRKQLRTSLKALAPKEVIEGALKKPDARPEQLSLDEFLNLFQEISNCTFRSEQK